MGHDPIESTSREAHFQGLGKADTLIKKILNSMLRNNDTCLNNDLLQALITEVDIIDDSQSLTIERLSDPTSAILLSTANFLTITRKLIMRSPGKFGG